MVSLNRHLLLLALGALLPLLVVGTVLALVLVANERANTERGLQENARLLAYALDAELQRSFAALEALGRSESLRRDDLRSFYAEAGDVRRAVGLWDNVLLLSPQADHILNLMRPFGTPLPPVPEPSGTLEAARTQKPYVSNVLRGRVETEWLMYIAYPIVHDGEPRYVIGATMSYRYWSQWLAERTPANSESAIVDRNEAVLARTRDVEQFVGKPVQQWYRDATAGRDSGVTRGENLGNEDVVSAFQKSALSGWKVVLSAPGALIDAPIWHAALWVSLSIVAALAVATLLALSRAAVLTQSMRDLQSALEQLRKARRLRGLRSPVAEIQSAMDAAQETADVLAARADSLERAQAAARLGLWQWDLRTNQVEWTGGIFELVGLFPDSVRPAHQWWLDRIHPDDRARVVANLEVIAQRGGSFAEEFRIRRVDGEVRWLASIGSVDQDDQGRPLRMQGVNIDITSRRTAEDALREADRKKDEFLATLAHELRNPLAPIRNALQLMKMADLQNPGLRAARDIMDRQVVHMVRLIDDLLDVSRISRGRLELQREPVEISKIVELALETSSAGLTQNLQVSLPDAPIFVDGDRIRLAQVVSNLLNNAAKYTDRSGEIRVDVRREGDRVAIAVRDSGIGIAPEELPMLFRMFSQSDSARVRSQGGLGIGLALARSLVELHGGTIEGRSEGLGKGSEFVVRLPVLQRAQQTRANDVESGPYAGPVRRVLVVDDVDDNVRSLVALLRIDGHVVETASDGFEALTNAERFKPDLILLDLGLPTVSGIETCRMIRKRPWGRGIVIVAVTGWGQAEDRRRTLEAGFDDHLVKPVDYAVVRRLLASALMA